VGSGARRCRPERVFGAGASALQPGRPVVAEGCYCEGEVAAVVTGCQVPRIRVVPEGDDHPLWDEVPEFVAATGTWLCCGRRCFAVATSGRRSRWRCARPAEREERGARAARDRRAAAAGGAVADPFGASGGHVEGGVPAARGADRPNDWYAKVVGHVWRTNGHESIEFTNGNRIRFRTRTRGGGRGFSGSPVVFDEAMYLPEVSMGAILPVISAQPDPQIWYMGSAVDQTLFTMTAGCSARVRERALAGRIRGLRISSGAMTRRVRMRCPRGRRMTGCVGGVEPGVRGADHGGVPAC
jgi:hypothetical protein